MRPVQLNSLATAVPSHKIVQSEMADVVCGAFSAFIPDMRQALAVFENAEVDTRYSSVPLNWYEKNLSYEERNDFSTEAAVDLCEEAARRCILQAGLKPADIGGIVVINNTVLAVPSLDALLIERMELKRDIARLPICGLGCVGGTLGLGRAAMMAQSEPGMSVLFLVIEMNMPTMWKGDLTKNRFVASALFGDGAAGAVVSCEGDGPAITGWGEYTWPNSLDLAGWNFLDKGQSPYFSRRIPDYVADNLAQAVDFYLKSQSMTSDDVDLYLMHPGGPKVLQMIVESLEISEDDLSYSREIMREYGNMSAATVLFILERALGSREGTFLLGSYGPGFTAGFVTLEV